jgi:hypothetical protein
VTLRNPMFSARFWNGKDAILKERLFDWQIIKEIMEKIKNSISSSLVSYPIATYTNILKVNSHTES